MTTHLVIPDTQVKEGVDLSHLDWIGQFILDKKPDVLIQIGDFADLPSLSSYDAGKKSFEGRRYLSDVNITKKSMDRLLSPMRLFNKKQSKNGHKQYKPRMVLTLGNHEDRISRAINDDPKLDGTIGIGDLGYAEAGWEVYPFLKPVLIDGVAYVHYVSSNFSNTAIGRAHLIANEMKMSCTVGHKQMLDYHYSQRKVNGSAVQCIIAGSCYLHDEDYRGAQGQDHWRGIIFKHRVVDGSYDPMFISLDYLKDRYTNPKRSIK